MVVLFVILVVLFILCQVKYLYELFKVEEIDYINMYVIWKVDLDYVGYDVEYFKCLCGVLLDDQIKLKLLKLGILVGQLFNMYVVIRVKIILECL